MIGKCCDERVGQRLHHYELGLLSDDDRKEFEIHLYSCDFCLEQVQRFQEAAKLMKHEQLIRNAVGEMASGADSDESSEVGRTSLFPKGWLKQRAWIPASSVIVILLLLLLLKPWGIRFEPTKEALASKKRIAVMYFENFGDPADESRLSEVVANLLITDLSEVYSLDVLSSQRLYDVMRLTGLQGQKTVSRDVAYEVARKARADFILVGSILQTVPDVVITTQLIDVESGLVIHSQRAMSEEGESIFDVVDKISADVCTAMPIPTDALDEIGKPVAQLTTYSSAAYRHYVSGVDYYNRYYFTEAAESFERAIKADSSFAMAYYYLSLLADEKLIHKAIEHSGNVSRMERVLITGQNAIVAGDDMAATDILKRGLELFPYEKALLYRLGQIYYGNSDYEQAVTYLERSVEADPLFETGFNMLAYAYDRLGNFGEALRAINQYISLAPDEPNPYDSRGDIYCSNGFFDRAAESYRMALDLDRNFFISQSKLGDAYFALNDSDAVRTFFEGIASGQDPSARPSARSYLALIPMRQGRLREAIAYLDDAILMDSLEASELWISGVSFKHSLKAKAYASLRQFDNAVEEMSEAIRYRNLHSPYDKSTYRCLYVEYLIEAGKVDSARAITASLEEEHLSGRAACSYNFARAMLFRKAGDLKSALNSLSCDPVRCNTFQFALAESRIFFELKMYAEAVKKLSGILESRCLGEAEHGFDVALVKYMMGVAHQELGFNDTARFYLNEFLAITAQGDADIVEIHDAKKRIASLMTSS